MRLGNTNHKIYVEIYISRYQFDIRHTFFQFQARRKYLEEKFRIKTTESNSEASKKCFNFKKIREDFLGSLDEVVKTMGPAGVVVLAVKPQAGR